MMVPRERACMGYPYPVVMSRFGRHLLLLLFALLASAVAGSVQAAQVTRIDIAIDGDGIDETLEEALRDNVRTRLSLQDAVGKDVTARRMRYLLRVAEDEVREALEPFGYYAPTITVQRSDRSQPEGERTTDDAEREAVPPGAGSQRAPFQVSIRVDPGQPVRVRQSQVAITGEGGEDRYLQQDIAAFQPQPGAVFDHTLYEQSKAHITRRLAERGYFDADFSSRRVEVTRAALAADIDLTWASGMRYDMGAITFTQQPDAVVRPQLLDKLVYWNQGEYYHQGRLDRLRTSLMKLDYFSSIDITPHPEQSVDGMVPVTVTLEPAKRSIYTVGASYGTDSGPGVLLGMERRYVNDRGHKALAQINYARNRKTLTTQYRVPAFAWLDGWYTGSLQFADEQTDYIDSRRLELVASRSGQYSRDLNLVASVHALRERWAYAFEDDGNPDTPVLYQYANYVFPALSAEYSDVDNLLAPRRGIGGSVLLRGGLEGAGSDASFAQLHARASWFRGLGPQDRLIVRGELGHTFTDAVTAIAPSLRFYAGGDRSIRGYNWREVGPRLLDRDGKMAFATGAKNVITTSVEYERYVRGPWGFAVFVDGGDAFDGRDIDWHTGVGAGVRWKSPVGPIRVDIARGLNDPESSFTLHLNIGSDL